MNALLSSRPETETGTETGTETEYTARGAEPTGTGAHDARRIPVPPAAPGPLASFARFVLCGGGIGVLSGFAVPLVAGLMPWAVANAVITVVSTLLCTELHARFTFGSGKHAGWRQHWQSAGSAAAAYAVTSVAILILHTLQTSPSMLTEQIVYLSASGLAGIGRFLLLRLYVFAGGRTRATEPVRVNGPARRPHRALAWA
ncbi:GtrA family protein [Streptomyces mirabilis]|uniref:Putative flippase GtrA (Transmembrane translocase of bactoprenol-linked glucose) n=1 Tax=Streptomyces mirabilis TaxID=68239 RepID=A0A1I2PXH6_9ACTN|nr:Putative flippase GtrA (transmembrane translocase of bactoprenol-linked glucose) [Streptomyces mirabilis]